MERSSASLRQPRQNGMNELAGALRRASEDTPSSVALRRDIVDGIYEHLLSTCSSQTALASACDKFVMEGLPEDPMLANVIVGELLQRFEYAKSDMIGEAGVRIMQSVKTRYSTNFANLAEFYTATGAPEGLVADNFKAYVEKQLSAYHAAAASLKKEYQKLARSLGQEVSDGALSRLTLSEMEELTTGYLHERSGSDTEERGRRYKRIAKGDEKDSRGAMEQLIHAPDAYKESWDNYTSISSRASDLTNTAANEIADFIKEVDSSRVIVNMLSYSLSRIGKDHYLALELIRRLAPDEIDGYAVMGDHVNSIAEALTSGEPARVFLARRKLLAMITRKFQNVDAKAQAVL